MLRVTCPMTATAYLAESSEDAASLSSRECGTCPVVVVLRGLCGLRTVDYPKSGSFQGLKYVNCDDTLTNAASAVQVGRHRDPKQAQVSYYGIHGSCFHDRSGTTCWIMHHSEALFNWNRRPSPLTGLGPHPHPQSYNKDAHLGDLNTTRTGDGSTFSVVRSFLFPTCSWCPATIFDRYSHMAP